MQASKSFVERLKNLDSQLVVYWNPYKGCWMIDRKVDGQVNTNVLVCKADNGDALPLNDNIIERLQSMDAWKEYGTYEAFHAANLAKEAEGLAKIDTEVRENYRLAAIDDKRQLHRAYDLIKTHDVARINQ